MSWDALLQPGIVVRNSPVESVRFGYAIDRMTIGADAKDTHSVLSAIKDNKSDILIVRYDASRLDLAAALALSPRLVLPAGAITYWEKRVQLQANLALGDLTVVGAETVDPDYAHEVVQTIVASSFHDYRNHYAANPLLDASAALAGYAEWAQRCLSNDPRNVLIMLERGRAIGLATLEADASREYFEVLLAGLIPTAQGKGSYGILLEACDELASRRGATRLIISTQVHNTRVQRAWTRHGLRPFAAIETAHLVEPALFVAREK